MFKANSFDLLSFLSMMMVLMICGLKSATRCGYRHRDRVDDVDFNRPGGMGRGRAEISRVCGLWRSDTRKRTSMGLMACLAFA